MKRIRSVLFALLAATGSATLYADSYYRQRPEDPRAVYLTKDQFDVHADGIGDNAEALQGAINRVQETARIGVVLRIGSITGRQLMLILKHHITKQE